MLPAGNVAGPETRLRSGTVEIFAMLKREETPAPAGAGGTPSPIGQLWFTPQELAERWRVHPSTIHRMHRDDPDRFGVKFRDNLRIHIEEILRYERREAKRASTAKVTRTASRGRRWARPAGGVDHFAD